MYNRKYCIQCGEPKGDYYNPLYCEKCDTKRIERLNDRFDAMRAALATQAGDNDADNCR